MAKNPIKLINSFTGQIVAGRVNPKTNMFVGALRSIFKWHLKLGTSNQYKIGYKLYRFS